MSVGIDKAPIIQEELDRLGYPLPLGASPASLDRRVQELLAEAGITRFTESDYRRLLRQAIKELSDNRDDTRRGSPNLAGVSTREENPMRLAARADELLTARAVFDPTADEYMAACAEARAELDEPDEPEASQGIGHDKGLELHVQATKILRARNLYGDDVTSELYADALKEAAKVLSINLTGRSA
jgi:superfamily I DNA/RNA helicase